MPRQLKSAGDEEAGEYPSKQVHTLKALDFGRVAEREFLSVDDEHRAGCIADYAFGRAAQMSFGSSRRATANYDQVCAEFACGLNNLSFGSASADEGDRS
jgi:hypothetical protein